MPQTHADPLKAASNTTLGELNLTLFRWVSEGRSWSGRERNTCFLNTHASQFADVSAASGLDLPDDARAICVTDWDHDGDQDLWVVNFSGPQVRLFKNESPTTYNYLAIQLEGRTGNRDAIGARVEVELESDGQKLIRSLRAGEGYRSQSSKVLHFGLGTATQIKSLVVRWPGGKRESFGTPSVNKRYRCVEGEGKPVDQSVPARSIVLNSTPIEAPAPDESWNRTSVAMRIPLPQLNYETLQGEKRDVQALIGRPLLVTFWATWCPECLIELRTLAENKALLETDLQLLAISLDGLEKRTRGSKNSTEETRKLVGDTLKKLKIPFDAGVATPELVHKLQLVHQFLFEMQSDFPIPVSLLITANGELAIIYKGAVSPNQVLSDLSLLDSDAESLARSSMVFPGRWLIGPNESQAAGIGKVLYDHGYFEDAEPHCRRAVAFSTNDAITNFNLGIVLEELDQREEAIIYLKKAIELDPLNPFFRDAMGVALMKRGKLDDAADCFVDALSVIKNDVNLLANLGLVQTRQGKLKEAMDSLNKAIEIDPRHAAANNNIAVILARLNEFDRAAKHFQTALLSNPQDANARNNLGLVYLRQKRYSEAAVEFEKIHKHDSLFLGARINLAKARVALGELEDALQVLDDLLASHADSAPAQELRAQIMSGKEKLGVPERSQ